MKQRSSKRPEEMLLTLVVILLICLDGNSATALGYKLNCLSNYLFTIDCSLVITELESRYNSSWLTFSKRIPAKKFRCPLEDVGGRYHCSFTTCLGDVDMCDVFTDVDAFQISLCHDGLESNTILDGKYMPVLHIKPNPPCCLTVSQNSSQHHFTWESTYEDFSHLSALIENLNYELHYYRKNDHHNVRPHLINTNNLKYSINDEVFAPGTDYVARVRSTPSGDFYKGQWSEWSSEVHWRTETVVGDSRADLLIPTMVQVLIFSFVVLPFIIFLCYVLLKKLRKSTFIPTPAPYFQSLYTKCQGDFKSWAETQENTTDTLKAEETSPIDSLTKCVVVEEDDCPQVCHQSLQGSTYKNISDFEREASLLGIPFTVSTMALPASSEDSFKPGSPSEGDSGCWLSSDMSLERYPPWYCNEYCTLNAFQQPSHIPEKTCALGSVTDMGAIRDEEVNAWL